MIKKSVLIGAAGACVFATTLPAQACPFDHPFGGHGHFDFYYYQDQPSEQGAENDDRGVPGLSEVQAPRAMPSFAKRDYLNVKAPALDLSSQAVLGSEDETLGSDLATMEHSPASLIQGEAVD